MAAAETSGGDPNGDGFLAGLGGIPFPGTKRSSRGAWVVDFSLHLPKPSVAFFFIGPLGVLGSW